MRIQQRVSFILGFSSIHVVYEFCFTYTIGKKPNIGPITQKKAFKRERTVESPLPNPFPLPHHFPSAVEAGLITQNPAVIPKYLSCVAGSMLCYKLYPTRKEYIQVAVEILNKHGWMKSKLGPPTVSTKNHSHMQYHFSVITKQQIKPI